MKIRIIVSLFLAILVCACSSTDFRSRKRVTQGIDYSRYRGNEAYYEFSSPFPPEQPSVSEEQTEPPVSGEETPLGEDEDFTSENMAGTYGNYGDVVVPVAARKFKLGPSASRKEMAVFQKAMERGYAKALRTYRPSGFTYAMSGVGTVNPLSDVEVSCKLSERSANDVGQATCTLFFNEIRTQYLELSKEAN